MLTPLYKLFIFTSLSLLLCSCFLLKGIDFAPARAQENMQVSQTEPFRDEIPADSDAVRAFINKHSFDNPSFRRQQSIESQSTSNPAQDAIQNSKQVRMIYLIPSDKLYKENYRTALANAIISLQRFYQNQVGNNYAFSLHTPIVETYVLSHPSAFYSTGANNYAGGFWESVLKDGFALTGGGFNDPNYRWVFYIDADQACGQYMGGNAGVALLAANDFRGLTGQQNIPACSNESPDNSGAGRWIGGLGHELGHTFNLPHPPGCDQGNCPSYSYNSLMYVGYSLYPNTYLLDDNKTQLLNSGFFSALDTSSRIITGRITDQSGNGLSGASVAASGTTSKSTLTDSNGNYALNGLTLDGNYTITPSKQNYSFSPISQNINNLGTDETISFTATLVTAPTAIVTFSSGSYSVSEAVSTGLATLTVNRTGTDTSAAVSVDYITSDSAGTTPCQNNQGTAASALCDYSTQAGTIRFAANDTAPKTIQIPIINDAYAEPNQSFNVTLSNPQGAALGTNSAATLFILDDDTQTATQNPIDNQSFFIQEQYIDFLGRQPEAGGVQFWIDVMSGSKCPPGETCDRTFVAKSFYEATEFQERGFYVYSLYDAVLGRFPLYAEFVPDVARLNGPQTVQEQRLSKDAYLADFMKKTEFTSAYGQYLTSDHLHAKDAANAQSFVDALCQKSGITPASKQTLITNLQNGVKDPAHTLEDFILVPEISGPETDFYAYARIVMQYFGFLRRDPEEGAVDFWWKRVGAPGAPFYHDYRQLVGNFLESPEYNYRFALINSH